mmetsp:Transcript_53256/g.158809  ORF Transcript_53256/g.158809 Transcript_53256/m.158809 type:complete len:217 (-) Transcript_53256:502-1152(-)
MAPPRSCAPRKRSSTSAANSAQPCSSLQTQRSCAPSTLYTDLADPMVEDTERAVSTHGVFSISAGCCNSIGKSGGRRLTRCLAAGSQTASSSTSSRRQTTRRGSPSASHVAPDTSHATAPLDITRSSSPARAPFSLTTVPRTVAKPPSLRRQVPWRAWRSAVLPGGLTGRAKPLEQLRWTREAVSTSYRSFPNSKVTVPAPPWDVASSSCWWTRSG